jgi:hypothetical protein
MNADPNEPAATKPPRCRFRKLRIAWSSAFGIVCVLLIVLWVRSYTWADSLRIPRSVKRAEYYFINSSDGLVYMNLKLYGSSEPGFGVVSDAIVDEALFADDATPLHDCHWFRIVRIGGQTVVYVSDLSLVLFSAVLAAAPWVRWSKRFSLRTLLIATTLVAVGLGLIVWLSH